MTTDLAHRSPTHTTPDAEPDPIHARAITTGADDMTDARRGRDGEPLDTPDELDNQGTHECTDGWAGQDHAGRPIPCTVCRPHLATRAPQRRPWWASR